MLGYLVNKLYIFLQESIVTFGKHFFETLQCNKLRGIEFDCNTIGKMSTAPGSFLCVKYQRLFQEPSLFNLRSDQTDTSLPA